MPRRSPFVHALWIACAALVLLGSGVGAQERNGGSEAPRPTLAVGALPPGLILDGRLDDAAWRSATDSIAHLTTIEPREGAEPVGRTVVKVLANATDIVIGVRCDDPHPAGIVSHAKARDAVLDDEDYILLVFDTFLDGRSGYVFSVNPSGARTDGLVVAEGEESNTNWDAIWEAKTTRDSTGWSAEIRIPARSLGFRKDHDRWGFNVERHAQRRQETSRWSGISRDFEITQTSHSGELTGLPAFDLGRGLSVRPALVTRTTRPSRYAETDYEAELSLDATKTLGPNLLSSLTINTDFAETEVDARQINLTRFPVFFPEKRSFFLNGSDIFEFGLGLDEESLIPFFSRRIGLFGVDEEDQVEIPIDAGAKVSGRLGDTHLGALVVGTRPIEDLRLVEEDLVFNVPRTTMGAVRVKQNVFEESSVGLLGTFGDQLGRSAYTAGADFTYHNSSFRDDQNLLVGVWGLRNDRKDLHGEKTAFGLRIDYPNDPVDINLSTTRLGDGFDPSLGFVPRNGVQIWDLSTTISPRPWWPGVRELTQELNFTLYNKLDNSAWESYTISARPFDLLFHSGDRFEFAIEPEGDRVPPDTAYSIADNVDIATGSYEWTRFTVGGHSAEKRRVRADVVWEWGDYYSGKLSTLSGGISIKPHDMVLIEATGEHSTGHVVGLAEAVGGSDSLASLPIKEDLVSLRLELNVSSDFQIASVTQYDTQSREFGSNNRLRWTFHPQGDLFVVYNHNMFRTRDNRWHFKSNQIPIKVQYTWRF